MNEQIFFFFYNLSHQSVFFDKLVIFFAVYFIYIVIILALLFLVKEFLKNPPDRMASVIRARWKDFILLCVSGGLAWGVAKILKILIHTERPFDLFPQVQILFTETGYAFPSGHTMIASAIAFTLFFTHKKAGYIFMFFALLIGLARIIAGVHFPVDIFGGFVLGALVALCVRKLTSKLGLS